MEEISVGSDKLQENFCSDLSDPAMYAGTKKMIPTKPITNASLEKASKSSKTKKRG